jgi:2-keto-3-deoxy-L-rhamnonate aldolase RhmA
MDILRNRLGSKEYLLGLSLMYPVPGIIERIGPDWDWIWIDGQHGQFDYNSILQCVRACERMGIPSVVRVPSHEYGIIGSVLDTCTNGIMVPMVNTGEQGGEAVKAAKFPPVGYRSYGGRRPIDMYGRSYAHTANDDVILIAQIETQEGLANADKIASVSGVDALFFGPDDMSMQRGMPMDKPRDTDLFKNEMEKVANAAKKAGKIAGTVTTSAQLLEAALSMGYRLCVGTSDVSLLAEGSTARRKNLIFNQED